ncbi:MAG: hypothetical protein C0482_19595 [Gordonia sp.]|nr:hypothetical protein [Gordonia sp. (in: high G+C Gram-positive bacteria)]
MSVTTDQRDLIEVLDARFQERRAQVPVLAQRAEGEGITEIGSREDLVPLLFPHTTYKSYPESLIAKGKWAQMNRWLDSLSTHRVADIDVDGVQDVDDWIDRLEAAGHMVSSSSGTSGKGSFLNKTQFDRDTSSQNMLDCLAELGLPPANKWNFIPVGPETTLSSHIAMREMLAASYRSRDSIELPPTSAPGGHHRYMSRLQAMRRAMADGTAAPDEVAQFEAEAARRQEQNEERLHYFAQQIRERRSERFFFSSQFPNLYRLTEILREMGVEDGDLTGDNALTTGGGLKGTSLPDDYQSKIYRLLNIDPSRFLHYYSMQELNLRMPKCLAGRYHVPAEVVLLVLDKNGETLAPVSDGQVEGRAGFFDTTVDGRWGGTISGDKIRANLGGCPCGRPGTTVFDQISRYSDLKDDDKITCAGTMDAYVRGFIED